MGSGKFRQELRARLCCALFNAIPNTWALHESCHPKTRASLTAYIHESTLEQARRRCKSAKFLRCPPRPTSSEAIYIWNLQVIKNTKQPLPQHPLPQDIYFIASFSIFLFMRPVCLSLYSTTRTYMPAASPVPEDVFLSHSKFIKTESCGLNSLTLSPAILYILILAHSIFAVSPNIFMVSAAYHTLISTFEEFSRIISSVLSVMNKLPSLSFVLTCTIYVPVFTTIPFLSFPSQYAITFPA